MKSVPGYVGRAGLALLAFSALATGGCVLLPAMSDSHVTADEVIVCRLRPREPDEPVFLPLDRGLGVDDVLKLAAKAGAFWIRKTAAEFGGEYGAERSLSNAVRLQPQTNVFGRPFMERRINQTLQVERYAEGRRCLALLVDFISERPEGSETSYFRMVPRSLIFSAAKARMSGRLPSLLKADRINLTVGLTVILPDGRLREGQTRYEHTITIPEVKPGDKLIFGGEAGGAWVSMPFEVTSEGPMAVNVHITEGNPVAKPLRKAADAMK